MPFELTTKVSFLVVFSQHKSSFFDAWLASKGSVAFSWLCRSLGQAFEQKALIYFGILLLSIHLQTRLNYGVSHSVPCAMSIAQERMKEMLFMEPMFKVDLDNYCCDDFHENNAMEFM